MSCIIALILSEIVGLMHCGKLGRKGLDLLKSKMQREERRLKRISSSRMSRCVYMCVHVHCPDSAYAFEVFCVHMQVSE